MAKEHTHLDCRSKAEYETTGVIEGAVPIPLSELPSRTSELRGKPNIIVNCRTGLRARLASSILASHGISAKVLVEPL